MNINKNTAIILEIVEVEGDIVHYILSACDEDGDCKHSSGIVEAGDDIPISEILDTNTNDHEQGSVR